ncbi:MAG TPA: hypothetical protein VGF24_01680 [Vicinamibacterales bacterium]|jgi:hypothetical protein
MPTAKFVADFTSFSEQLDKAAEKIDKLGLAPRSVEASLKRMADSFSGTKIIQEALTASRAIDEVGGTSKLTAAELSAPGLRPKTPPRR